MKKHTFKSVSANRRTSSRSGESAKTDGTGKILTKRPTVNGRYGAAAEKINRMSPDAFRETLVRLGISKPNGKLTVKYVLKKNRSSKPERGE